MNLDRKNSGQVALVMVLIMTVVSAVVISVASRATLETRMQGLESENTEAFLVAQSGIEEALSKNLAVSGQVAEGKSYVVSSEEVGMESLAVERMESGTSVDVTIDGAENLTGLRVHWSPIDGTGSAVLVTVRGESGVVDSAFDEIGQNGFTAGLASGLLGGVNYQYKTADIVVPANTELARVSLYGTASKLAIEPIGAEFPAQLLKLKSIATLGEGSNKSMYGLEYQESKNNKLPEVFDYALFSHGTIIQ